MRTRSSRERRHEASTAEEKDHILRERDKFRLLAEAYKHRGDRGEGGARRHDDNDDDDDENRDISMLLATNLHVTFKGMIIVLDFIFHKIFVLAILSIHTAKILAREGQRREGEGRIWKEVLGQSRPLYEDQHAAGVRA